MTVYAMRAVIMFDCCLEISTRALCLNPVSMVINWGLPVFTLEQQRLEEFSYRCYCCPSTLLLNKLARKMRADSV